MKLRYKFWTIVAVLAIIYILTVINIPPDIKKDIYRILFIFYGLFNVSALIVHSIMLGDYSVLYNDGFIFKYIRSKNSTWVLFSVVVLILVLLNEFNNWLENNFKNFKL